jgi:hypothetical protein
LAVSVKRVSHYDLPNYDMTCKITNDKVFLYMLAVYMPQAGKVLATVCLAACIVNGNHYYGVADRCEMDSGFSSLYSHSSLIMSRRYPGKYMISAIASKIKT